MSVTRRGAGCGSLAGDRRVACKAQVQAAPRRGTAPGDGGGAFHRWRWSRPVTRRASQSSLRRLRKLVCVRRNLSAFRGDFARAESHNTPHEAAGRLRARRSARPSQGQGCKTCLRRPPRRKEQGRRSYGFFLYPPPCGEGRERSERGGVIVARERPHPRPLPTRGRGAHRRYNWCSNLNPSRSKAQVSTAS